MRLSPETLVVLKAALENLNRAVELVQQENEHLIAGKAVQSLVTDAAAMLMQEVRMRHKS